jgi:iron complex outermembrane receptor protein
MITRCMTTPPRLLLAAVLSIVTTASSAQTSAPADLAVPLAPIEVRASRAVADEAAAGASLIALDLLPLAQPGVAGLAGIAPNFSVASSGARSFGDIFAVRGLTNSPFFGDPAVAVYLDDVPLGAGFTFPTELAGFAGGALLRGPGQNTRFGRAGPGGVLQFTTPAPAIAGRPEHAVGVSYGNFNARTATLSTGVANGSGDVLVRAGYAARDGYVMNTTLNAEVDPQESLSALARLRFRPAARAELTLLLTAQRARDGAQPLVPLGGPFFTVARTAEGQTDMDVLNVGLTAAFDTAVGRLTATTAHTDWELGPYSNSQELFPGFELANDLTLRQRLWSEELRFTGDQRADVRWSGGALFSDGSMNGTVARSAGFPIEASSYRMNQRTLAAFGEVAVKVSDVLTLTPGLRVETNRKDFSRTETVPTPGTSAQSATSGAVLPKLAASYTISPGTTLFASAGAGYKPGGFSSFTGSASLAAFGPERTIAFETGLTRESADHAYTATVRAFWYEIKGYQIERSFTATDYFVANADRARSRGAELELEWRPVAGLTVQAGLGWTDVTLRRFTAPFSATPSDGNRAPYVPNYDASLRVTYRHENGWFVGVDASAAGKTFYDESETAATAQRTYGLLGAQLGWENRRWRVGFYGENLTGEEYYSSITAGIGHGTPGAPRTYGVQATLKF